MPEATIDHGDGSRAVISVSLGAATWGKLESEFGFPPSEAAEAIRAAVAEISDLHVSLSATEKHLEDAEQDLEDFVAPHRRMIALAAELIHEGHEPQVEPKRCLHPSCEAFHRALRET
jgi:hypothetical protein